MLPLALLRLPAAVTRNRPIIGYWAWEMPDMPPEWRPAAACVNQVWVPSRFTAAALEPLMRGRDQDRAATARHRPASPVRARPRGDFGLPPDAVVVLVSFNLASSFVRKNPFAAIAAFRGAFGDRPDRILVLKVSHPDHAPADFARLTQMAQAPNIRIDTRTLPPADRHALTACADIVLSLHRGEGFGLVMAEAMLLGKPVVATGWSGNTDFMDTSNAALGPLPPCSGTRRPPGLSRPLGRTRRGRCRRRPAHARRRPALRRRLGERARPARSWPTGRPPAGRRAGGNRMKILVWQWGRRGAGPRFAACLADALRGRPGIDVTLSLCRDAEILAGPARRSARCQSAPTAAWHPSCCACSTAPLALPFLLLQAKPHPAGPRHLCHARPARPR